MTRDDRPRLPRPGNGGEAVTGCTAGRYGDHDHSQPPHNTPGSPRDAQPDGGLCQSWAATACDDMPRYEVTVYQPGTHEWIRLLACVPCTAELRRRYVRNGPGGTRGIARVAEIAIEGERVGW